MNTQCIEDSNDMNVHKSALNPANCSEVFTFLMEAKAYILSLKVRTLVSKRLRKIILSSVSTGFCGFIVNIVSFTAIYRDFVEEKHWMLCLATYRFSQDHLEMLFGKIRTLNGHNDNPTAPQFCSAYRKLLFDGDIVLSEGSNVDALCSSNVLTVSSTIKQPTDIVPLDELQIEEELASFEPDMFQFEMEEIVEQFHDTSKDPGIAHIANELGLRLKRCGQVYCQLCLKILLLDEKVGEEMCVNLNEGKPCKSTFELCKIADRVMNVYVNSAPDYKDKVYISVLRNIAWEDIFPNFFECEEDDHGEDHKKYLVKFFIDEYINIICAHNAKQITISTRKKFLRNRLKKLVHHYHQ